VREREQFAKVAMIEHLPAAQAGDVIISSAMF
jgi:hypothetical protein